MTEVAKTLEELKAHPARATEYITAPEGCEKAVLRDRNGIYMNFYPAQRLRLTSAQAKAVAAELIRLADNA